MSPVLPIKHESSGWLLGSFTLPLCGRSPGTPIKHKSFGRPPGSFRLPLYGRSPGDPIKHTGSGWLPRSFSPPCCGRSPGTPIKHKGSGLPATSSTKPKRPPGRSRRKNGPFAFQTSLLEQFLGPFLGSCFLGSGLKARTLLTYLPNETLHTYLPNERYIHTYQLFARRTYIHRLIDTGLHLELPYLMWVWLLTYLDNDIGSFKNHANSV